MQGQFGCGKLARHFFNVGLPLQVLKSNAGYYIGTTQEESGWAMPFTRESIEYFQTEDAAVTALETGRWTQKRSL